jgi:hypothetical protein
VPRRPANRQRALTSLRRLGGCVKSADEIVFQPVSTKTSEPDVTIPMGHSRAEKRWFDAPALVAVEG